MRACPGTTEVVRTRVGIDHFGLPLGGNSDMSRPRAFESYVEIFIWNVQSEPCIFVRDRACNLIANYRALFSYQRDALPQISRISLIQSACTQRYYYGRVCRKNIRAGTSVFRVCDKNEGDYMEQKFRSNCDRQRRNCSNFNLSGAIVTLLNSDTIFI